MAEWMDCAPCCACGRGHAEGADLKVCSECGDPYCIEHLSYHEEQRTCWDDEVRDIDGVVLRLTIEPKPKAQGKARKRQTTEKQAPMPLP